jgi:NTP pyrophosphatase (non-canonical NTP hydrolase)
MEQNQAAVGPMDLEFYQKRALNTAVFERNDYPLIALGEEVGEVMGKIAKFGRKNNMSVEQVINAIANPQTSAVQELREAVLKEMGDVLWQWAVLAKVFGFGAHEIAWANLDKLSDRQGRGVLNGEGDNR